MCIIIESPSRISGFSGTINSQSLKIIFRIMELVEEVSMVDDKGIGDDLEKVVGGAEYGDKVLSTTPFLGTWKFTKTVDSP